MQFRAQALDRLSEYSRSFVRSGFVSMNDFLDNEQAVALADSIAASDEWLEIFRGTEQAYEMLASEFEALAREQKDQLDKLVWQAANTGLQYRYRSIRVPDALAERKARDGILDRFAMFMSSPEMIGFFRRVTGDDRINFADAQATAYVAGHFLTSHDDDVDGKDRSAAYVLSLTENWSEDWGGLLLFPEGDRFEGFSPAFNSLRIFSVPRAHSVTYVAPFAERTRYSITGWLRRSRYP